MKQNWGWKLTSVIVALVLWGGLISEDATLTREKAFSDVTVNVVNAEILQRNGLIVVEGLDKLQPIKIHTDVPQKLYDSVTPSNYNIRVDLSRITASGEQTLPILSTSTTTFGSVVWMSEDKITVKVDDYITRRRIPVQLAIKGTAPAGFYAASPSVDPGTVVISGPRNQVESVARVVASYNASSLTPNAGAQFAAAPFELYDEQNLRISKDLISVTSENVLLDTLLVEQTLFPVKEVAVNLTGITRGEPLSGYHISSITADPGSLQIAGGETFIDSIKLLDISAPIDVQDLTQTIIRAVKVNKPANAVFLSESAVYITVEILPDSPASGGV